MPGEEVILKLMRVDAALKEIKKDHEQLANATDKAAETQKKSAKKISDAIDEIQRRVEKLGTWKPSGKSWLEEMASAKSIGELRKFQRELDELERKQMRAARSSGDFAITPGMGKGTFIGGGVIPPGVGGRSAKQAANEARVNAFQLSQMVADIAVVLQGGGGIGAAARAASNNLGMLTRNLSPMGMFIGVGAVIGGTELVQRLVDTSEAFRKLDERQRRSTESMMRHIEINKRMADSYREIAATQREISEMRMPSGTAFLPGQRRGLTPAPGTVAALQQAREGAAMTLQGNGIDLGELGSAIEAATTGSATYGTQERIRRAEMHAQQRINAILKSYTMGGVSGMGPHGAAAKGLLWLRSILNESEPGAKPEEFDTPATRVMQTKRNLSEQLEGMRQEMQAQRLDGTKQGQRILADLMKSGDFAKARDELKNLPGVDTTTMGRLNKALDEAEAKAKAGTEKRQASAMARLAWMHMTGQIAPPGGGIDRQIEDIERQKHDILRPFHLAGRQPYARQRREIAALDERIYELNEERRKRDRAEKQQTDMEKQIELLEQIKTVLSEIAKGGNLTPPENGGRREPNINRNAQTEPNWIRMGVDVGSAIGKLFGG